MRSYAGVVVLGLLLIGFATYASTRAVDFPIYHHAGTQVLAGDYELYPTAVYDGTDRGDSHQFQYAPVVALLFVPFGWLPLGVAAFVFACLKIPAYGYIGWVIARRLRVETRYGRLMLVALIIVGGYFIEEFRYGNVQAFTTLLMVVAFDQNEKGRTAVPAAALALAIVTKLTPLALLAYFAMRRQFAMVVVTLAFVGALLVLPSLIFGVRMNAHLTEGFVLSAAGKVDESDNYSLRGALLRSLTMNPKRDPRYPPENVADVPVPLVSVVWVVLLCGLAFVMAVVLWNSPKDSDTRLLEFSLVLTAMLIVAPHTQRTHFATLFVPAAVLAGQLTKGQYSGRAMLVRAALGVNAAVATFIPMMLGSRRAFYAYQAFSPYFLATLVLLVVLLVTLADREASPAPVTSQA